jgi:hypothetical protein
MRKEINRHALRLALFFVGLILSIVIFLSCGANPRLPIEWFNKINRFVKPYSTLRFDKVNSSRPNLHLVTAKSNVGNHKLQSLAIAYDDRKIQIFESLSLTNLLTTHQIDGIIEYVDYFEGLSFIEGQSIKIACQYLSGSKRFLDLYNIDKNWNWDSEKNQIIPNAKPKLDKVLSIKFDDMKFICMTGDNSFFAANNKTFSIDYFDGKSTTPSKSFSFGKPFIFDFDYIIDSINVYAFDGKTFYYINKCENVALKAKEEVKESTGLDNSHFIPVTTEHCNLFNTNGIIMINDGKCFVLDSYNGSVIHKQLLLGDNSLKFYNIAQNHDKYYHFDEKQETSTPVKKNLSTCLVFSGIQMWIRKFIPSMLSHQACSSTLGLTSLMMIDPLLCSTTIIIFMSAKHLALMNRFQKHTFPTKTV